MKTKLGTRGCCALIAASFVFVAPPSAIAQSEDDATTEEVASPEATPPAAAAEQDVIISYGKRRKDNAMAAFERGDYETAEIEFQLNARCALRRERNLQATIDSGQREADRAETFQQATPSNSGAASQGQGAGTAPTGPTGPGATDNIRTDRDAPAGRTCEDRGFQLYMMGMSQLQLGKVEEALENFKASVVYSKILYDAHYRIALIALLRGNRDEAADQLRQIEVILKRCRDCDEREEIEQRIEHLRKALGGEVPLE